MKKCPRCKRDVADNHQYCPHCGYNLKQKNHMKWMRIIALISFFLIPFLYYFLLGGIDITGTGFNASDKLVLQEVTDRSATTIVYDFKSLEDFEKNVENVSTYIQDIKNYETTLKDDDISQSYYIAILDNYDISFGLDYSYITDNSLQVDIHKEYTRSQSVDYLEYSFTQKNISSLEDIVIDYDYIKNYISDTATVEKLYNQLIDRVDEFNLKRDSIGHFGFGQYSDNMSLVVYPDGDAFKVTLKYKVMK